MQKSLTKITDRLKVEEILLKLDKQKSEVELWQPIDGNNKLITQARVLRTNTHEIFFAAQNDLSRFDHGLETYCYSGENQIVFKSEISFLSQHKMALKRPEYLVYREDRTLPRIDVSDQSYQTNFYFGTKTPHITRLYPHSAKLLNYTQKGIAIQVKSSRIDQFYIGDHLTCKIPNKANSIKELTIVHITRLNKNLYTVGMKFSET